MHCVGLHLNFCFYYRISDKVEILKMGLKQLDVIKDCITYCNYKLRKERNDFFIEPNKALRASEILCVAVDSILREVNETKSNLKELEAMIIEVHIHLQMIITLTSIELVTNYIFFLMGKFEILYKEIYLESNNRFYIYINLNINKTNWYNSIFYSQNLRIPTCGTVFRLVECLSPQLHYCT